MLVVFHLHDLQHPTPCAQLIPSLPKSPKSPKQFLPPSPQQLTSKHPLPNTPFCAHKPVPPPPSRRRFFNARPTKSNNQAPKGAINSCDSKNTSSPPPPHLLPPPGFRGRWPRSGRRGSSFPHPLPKLLPLPHCLLPTANCPLPGAGCRVPRLAVFGAVGSSC